MIWAGVVNFIGLLVEDLELEEVQALLDEVYVSEVFQMEYELDDSAVRHNVKKETL